MASQKRIFVEGGVYHIYNRGNHRSQIFFSPEDNLHFLVRLYEYAKRENIEILAYCLMSNHFHLLLKQNGENSIIRLMRSLSVSYAKYHNWQYEQVGHIYQGRYGSRFIRDDADLANVARYIHRNPSSSGAIEEYRWSDLRNHFDLETKLLAMLGWSPDTYRSFVYEAIVGKELRPTSKVTASRSSRSSA